MNNTFSKKNLNNLFVFILIVFVAVGLLTYGIVHKKIKDFMDIIYVSLNPY